MRHLKLLPLALSGSLICLALAVNTPAQTDPPKNITSLFLHAWVPELGPLKVSANSDDAKLLEIAEHIRRGQFVPAENKIALLEKGRDDARTRFAARLFQLQLLRRRYAIIGGGRLFNGESQIDLVRQDQTIKDIFQNLDSLVKQMGVSEAQDANLAIAYNNALNNCIFENPPLIRLNRINYEFNREQLSASVGAPASDQLCVQTLSQINLNAQKGGLLDRVKQDLLDAMIRAAFAVANQDFASAKSIYESAAGLANRESLFHSEASFLLYRGDLEVAPYGDVTTLGYNLLAEEGVRMMLRFGEIPRLTITPPESQLAAAESWYKKADEIVRRVGYTNMSGALIVRQAHLARLRGDYPKASRLYSDAANAATDKTSRDATLAKVCAFVTEQIVSNDTSTRNHGNLLQEAIDSLAQNGDHGAVLSIAEIGNSVGTRLWYINRDVIRSSRILQQTISALDKNNHQRASADLLFTLSLVYMESGRSETSVQVAQDAILKLKAFVKKAETANAEFFRTNPQLGNDAVRVVGEKNRLAGFLSRLGTPLFKIYLEERTPFWRDQVEGIDREAETLAEEVATALPNLAGMFQQVRHSREASRKMAKFSDDVDTGFRSRLTCKGILEVYSALRPRAVELGDPINTSGLDITPRLNGAGLDLFAGRCNPELLVAPRAEIQKGDPVGSLRRALAAKGATQTMQTSMGVVAATRTVDTFFNLAANFESFELLVKWVDELDEVIKNNTELQTLTPLAQAYRATAMLGLNQPARARDILNSLISNNSLWAAQPVPFKIKIFDVLVEVETALGNADASLLAFERLRFEQEEWQGQKSGVRPVSRSSAELAMLERKAAAEGGLKEDDAKQLLKLRTEVESASQNNEKVPSLDSLRSAIARMPQGTTALIFHVGRRYITLWRVRANEAPKVMRLESPVDDVLRMVVQLERSLSTDEGNNDWEGLSEELYKRLIVPAGLTPGDSRLVFVVQGKLSLIPFEILGPDKKHLLLTDRPITYASRLTGERSSRPRSTARNATALVVGLSKDLENAESEATKIAELLGGTLLINQKASNENVRRSIGSARWIHFATHGQVNRTNPYLSYLKLFGNERIEAWQLFRDAPQAEVISLSACDTRQEPESLAAMSSMASSSNSLTAFAFAGGARWILASLWQADDKETEVLMTEFYRYQKVEKFDPPKALQMAKLKMITDGRHPYFYSQFILSSHDLSSLQR